MCQHISSKVRDAKEKAEHGKGMRRRGQRQGTMWREVVREPP